MAHSPTSIRPRRRRLTVVAVVALVAAFLVVPATPAVAGPTVAQIEAQIAAADNRLEPIIENYDKVHAQLAVNEAHTAALERTLQPLQLEATLATARIGQIAATLYQTGPVTSMAILMNSGASLSSLNAMSLLNEDATQRLASIKGLLAQRDKYAAAKKNLDDARTQLVVQNASLNAQAQTIEKQLTGLQALRQQVYGTSGAIGTLRPVACPFTYTSGKGGIAARKACTAIGKPYIWATAGPRTFDCSGLTLWAWAAAGVSLGHYTKWQWTEGAKVSRANLQPGDLVFWFPPSLHHMGIYVGGGWAVHAPHTGDYVRMVRIDTMPIAGFRRP